MLTFFLSEVLSTGLLVFILCMGCVDGFDHKPTHLSICLGAGFAVMLCLNIFGMVSGAHMNPAITLAAFVYKRVNFPVIHKIRLNTRLIIQIAQFIYFADSDCLRIRTITGWLLGLWIIKNRDTKPFLQK